MVRKQDKFGRGKVKKVYGKDVNQSGIRVGATTVSKNQVRLGKEAIETLLKSVQTSTTHMGKFTKDKKTYDDNIKSQKLALKTRKVKKSKGSNKHKRR